MGIQRKRVNWVLDADIRGFFDNMSHEWTMKFIQHRVGDRRMLRLIQKWLRSSSDGSPSETGSNVARENPRPSRFWDSRIFAEI